MKKWTGKAKQAGGCLCLAALLLTGCGDAKTTQSEEKAEAGKQTETSKLPEKSETEPVENPAFIQDGIRKVVLTEDGEEIFHLSKEPANSVSYTHLDVYKRQIYNGVNMWNEFSFAYTLTQSSANRTLPLAIWEFQGQYSMNTPMIMAVLTLSLLPMIVLFIIFQDKLVKGMTAGAVKG